MNGTDAIPAPTTPVSFVERFHHMLANTPPAIASRNIKPATVAATFQLVARPTANSEGRFTEGPAMSKATAAPTGAPDPSSIRASGISKNVGNASGTAKAATATMARTFAAGESNVRTGII